MWKDRRCPVADTSLGTGRLSEAPSQLLALQVFWALPGRACPAGWGDGQPGLAWIASQSHRPGKVHGA